VRRGFFFKIRLKGGVKSFITQKEVRSEMFRGKKESYYFPHQYPEISIAHVGVIRFSSDLYEWIPVR
jgi:hypothetical protein